MNNGNNNYWVDTESFNKIKDMQVVDNHVVYPKKRFNPTWIIFLILIIGGYFGYKYISEQKILITKENEKTKAFIGLWEYKGEYRNAKDYYFLNDLSLILFEDGRCSLNGTVKLRYDSGTGGSTTTINQTGKCYVNTFYNRFIMEPDPNIDVDFYEKWTDFSNQNNQLKIGSLEYKRTT